MLPKSGCAASVRPPHRKYEKPLDLQYSMNLDSAPLGVVGRIAVMSGVVPGGRIGMLLVLPLCHYRVGRVSERGALPVQTRSLFAHATLSISTDSPLRPLTYQGGLHVR